MFDHEVFSLPLRHGRQNFANSFESKIGGSNNHRVLSEGTLKDGTYSKFPTYLSQYV